MKDNKTIPRRPLPVLVAPIVLLAAAFTMLFAVQRFGFAGLLMLPAIFLIAYFPSRPTLLLLFYWCWIILSPSIETLTDHILINFFETVLALYLFALLLAAHAIQNRSARNTAMYSAILLSLFAYMVISAVANRVPLFTFSHYLLTYHKQFIVFLFVVSYADQIEYRAVFWVLAGTYLLQLAANIAFLLGLNPLPRIMYRAFFDAFMGTLADCQALAYYSIACIVICYACIYGRKGIKNKVFVFTLIVFAIIQFYLTYTMHAYPLLVGILVLQTLLFVPRSIAGMIKFSLVGTMLTAILILLMTYGPLADFAKLTFTPKKLEDKTLKVSRSLKSQAYYDVFMNSRNILPHPILGGGPGNYTSCIAARHGRPLAYNFLLYKDFGADQELLRLAKSVLGSPETGILTIWGELGLMGFILYWWLYAYAAFHVGKQVRQKKYADWQGRVLAESFVVLVAAAFVLNFLIDALPMPHLTVALWILGGIVWNPKNTTDGKHGAPAQENLIQEPDEQQLTTE